jgi:hypothetical protein
MTLPKVMKNTTTIRKTFNIVFLISILASATAVARVGESYEGITARLGEPGIEQLNKDTYGWSLDNRDSHYLVAVFNAKGRSVAEQVKSLSGPLDNEQIMKFFPSVNRHLTEKDFISNRPVNFAGFRLDFGKTARTYLDKANDLLYVWERGTNPSASIYNKKGIWISQQNRDMYNRQSWKRSAKLANKTRNYSLNKSTKVASK